MDEDDGPTPGAGPSSFSVPAPPRPPNPEIIRLHAAVHAKLHSELAALSVAAASDGQRLRATQEDLLQGEPAIRDEMARLEAVRDVCRTVAGRLREVVERAEMNVGELRRKGDPEVDELVCSTSIVHNQYVKPSLLWISVNADGVVTPAGLSTWWPRTTPSKTRCTTCTGH